MSEAATLLPQPTDDDTSTGMAPSATPRRAAIRPMRWAPRLASGTVLAQRYRLEELIRESPPTVTWRAFDQVLSRSVLVHLLPRRPERPRTAGRRPQGLGGHRLALPAGARCRAH